LTRVRAVQAASALLLVVVVALTLPDAGDASSPLATYAFHEPGQPALLLVRVGVLLFALSVLRESPRLAALVGALFLGSLASRVVLYPFVIAAIAGVLVAKRPAGLVGDVALPLSLVLALGLVGVERWKPVERMPDGNDPAAMVDYWQRKRNPFRARAWAITWANRERAGAGEGMLALARLDWELGRRPQARMVLSAVIKRPVDDAVRARAEAQLAAWSDVP
jgi:hypothetical protein